MNILIIHTAFIGDIVLSIPVIKELKIKYPNSKIFFLTTPINAQLLENNPNLEEVLIFDKKNRDKGLFGLIKYSSKLRKYKFDKIFVLHRYLRSSVLAYLSFPKEIIGFKSASGSFLYTKKIDYNINLHEIDRMISLVDEGSTKNTTLKPKIEIYVPVKVIEKVDKIWNEFLLNNKIIITLAPGSNWFTKMWPSYYYDKVINMLLGIENVVIILIGSVNDSTISLENSNKTLDLRGKTTLLEMAEILKRTDILVSNDSSPIHIGSAFDKPFIIAIFGPTTKSLGFTPSNLKNKVIEIENLDCRPCGLHGSKKCPKGHFKCMKEIYPEIIFIEIQKVIKLIKLQ